MYFLGSGKDSWGRTLNLCPYNSSTCEADLSEVEGQAGRHETLSHKTKTLARWW